jgi:hypothetical protein
MNALTVCACCQRPFQRGERIFRGALLTAGGCGVSACSTGRYHEGRNRGITQAAADELGAQRRVEARIGQLLGETTQGARTSSSLMKSVSASERQRFRVPGTGAGAA